MLCALLLPLQARAESPPLRIGILAFEPQPIAQARWANFAHVLQRRLPGHAVLYETLPLDLLDANIAKAAYDVIITNPGHYVILRDLGRVGQALSSLTVSLRGQRLTTFAGVMITRAQRDDIATLADLAGKTVAAPKIESLGGYQMQAFELLWAGVNPKNLRMHWTGMPHDRAVLDVLSGKADAGFVRTGVLERMIAGSSLQADQIKVLNRRISAELPLAHSTATYPEWAVAPSAALGKETATEVAIALLTLPQGSKELAAASIYGFDAPYNYDAVREVQVALGMPRFAKTRQDLLAVYWTEYRHWVFAAAAVLALMLAFGTTQYRTNRLLKQANAKLDQLSSQDGLTQVYNRRFLNAELARQLAISTRHGAGADHARHRPLQSHQ